MKAVEPVSGRTFVLPTEASMRGLRHDSRSDFRALAGARTPLSPDQARMHLNAAWRTVTGQAAPARGLALLQAQWALETGENAASTGDSCLEIARAGVLHTLERASQD